ncbi:MAG: hypothetical protein M3R57_00545 [Chloroflexota bacterium]|nr:hypothetical protein [Chloroflexota bacterium]
MRQFWLLALPLAPLTLAACGILGLSTSATEACAPSAREYSGTVVGAFSTTVGAIRALESRPAEPSRWPDLAPDQPAVLCYIDAQIAKGPPPGPSGEIRDPFDRVVIGVVDGKGEMVMAGYGDELPVVAP